MIPPWDHAVSQDLDTSIRTDNIECSSTASWAPATREAPSLLSQSAQAREPFLPCYWSSDSDQDESLTDNQPTHDSLSACPAASASNTATLFENLSLGWGNAPAEANQLTSDERRRKNSFGWEGPADHTQTRSATADAQGTSKGQKVHEVPFAFGFALYISL